MAGEHEEDKVSGRYRLLELVEEGVGGKLYRARDEEQDRAVLLKLVPPALSEDPQFRRYLYDRWAERDALFEHPNIVDVVEVGRSGQQYFAVVEDPEGERLSERMKEAPLEPDEVVEILHQIAEALRAAHRREVIHAHLKPSDVFIRRDSGGRLQVKVLFLDMGTAASESILSLFGELQGSPKYMAPETIRGAPPGPGADVFALGVIGYELLTAREPFPSEHPVGYLFANCEGSLTPPNAVQESVSRELSLVISRCLEKNPQRRYRSAQRVIDDLDRCVEITKTGRVSMVPRGSDSAFAREYELPEGRPPGRERATRTSPLSVIALVLAMGALVFLAVVNLPYLTRRLGRMKEFPRSIGRRQGARVGPETGAGVIGPKRRRDVSKARQERARKAYDALMKDWLQRHSLEGSYELAVAKFEALADEFADTPYGLQARETAAQIYCEWAERLAKGEKFQEAESHYRHVLEITPEGSRLRDVVARELPAVMAGMADQQGRLRRYEEALEIYRSIKEEFPGSVEAALLARKEPVLGFNRAYDLWKHEGKLQEAASQFRYVLKNYPESNAAADSRKYLPEVYFDIAAGKFQEGNLQEAHEDLAKLGEAFDESRVGRRAAELDAEVLFRLYEAARQNNDGEGASRHFSELAAEHPESEWTQTAYRRRLGLTCADGDVMFDATTAQSMYAEAEQYLDQMRYEAALNMLRTVIRYTRPGSEAGRKALGKLPECMYYGALDASAGQQEECRQRLQELARDFSHTPWAERARKTLRCIKNAPEGMVFVPEGAFPMGASQKEIVQFLERVYPPRILQSERELELVLILVGYVSEIPRHVATTGAFYIDRTEVTNAQYKRFVDETDYRPPPHWQNETFAEGEADQPVTNVCFEEAAAYAKWAGKRLPTEAEWEKAARGVDGRFYPWGNAFDRNSCHHMRKTAAGTVPVGSYPGGASPWGVLDMLGNVWEWTDGWFVAYPGNERTDTRAPYGETCRVLRGGAWYQHDLKPVPIRVTFRLPVKPDMKGPDMGFRCAQDAE